MVDVAVVGVGKVGASLAGAWHRAGLDVALSARELDSSTVISLAASFGLRRLSVADALWTARAVVLADPLDDVATLFASVVPHAPAVIIDASSGSSPISSVTALRAHVGGSAVYRAFNTLGWSDYVDPTYGAEVPDMFYAGPDDDGRDTVEGLIGSLGLRPIYAGGYEQIELIDALAALRTAVAAHRPGLDLAVKLLERRN